MPLRGRKQFDKECNVYFITTTLFNFEKIFDMGETYNLIMTDSLKHLIKEHRASLYAYVIMPTHLHILIHIPVGESIIDFMRDFKRFTANKILKQLELDGRKHVLKRLKVYAKGYNRQTYKIWMDRYDDVIVTSENIFNIKMEYIHFNPVKAGLVENMEDWKFSSYRNYTFDDQSIIEVKTDLSYKD